MLCREGLEAQVEALSLHFESHYDALDRAARQDALQVLTPAWRTPLEKSYLWIGDWHPALFINLFHGLVAHYLDRLSLEPATSEKNYSRKAGLAYASEDLLNKVENIKMVLRTMVPALFHRMRRSSPWEAPLRKTGCWPCTETAKKVPRDPESPGN